MQIQMNATVYGSNDGRSVQSFRKGAIYDTETTISHGLASQFVQRKQAAWVNALSFEQEMTKLMGELEQARAERLNDNRI